MARAPKSPYEILQLLSLIGKNRSMRLAAAEIRMVIVAKPTDRTPRIGILLLFQSRKQ